MTLTAEQEQELKRLKAYFPYRIVFGVVRTTGEWEAYAKTTMATANRLTREGHAVFVLK
jgi:hypothetical protein